MLPLKQKGFRRKISRDSAEDRFNGGIGEYWCRLLEVLPLGRTDGGGITEEYLNGSGVAKKIDCGCEVKCHASRTNSNEVVERLSQWLKPESKPNLPARRKEKKKDRRGRGRKEGGNIVKFFFLSFSFLAYNRGSSKEWKIAK